jgi:subtilase family serine protease
VGGTSIDLLNIDGTTSDTGWGTNQNAYLAIGGTPEPPYPGNFQFGAGGGESTLIAKPKWQKALSGKGRQQPDIADIADPYTGTIIVYNGGIGVIGGTSAASPVFSAIWSLASQKAGGAALGQAPPCPRARSTMSCQLPARTMSLASTSPRTVLPTGPLPNWRRRW